MVQNLNRGANPPTSASSSVDKQLISVAPRPCSHDPKQPLVSKDFNLCLRKRFGPSCAWKLLKFLLAKVVVEGRWLNNQEQFLFTECVEKVSSKNDDSYKIKVSKEWLVLEETIICVYSQDSRESFEDVLSFGKRCLFGQKLLSSHAYFGWAGTFNVSEWVGRLNRKLRKKSSTKRWMGVGYKDHGYHQDVAIDGTPHWKEVASSSNSETYRSAPLLGDGLRNEDWWYDTLSCC